MKEPIWVLPQVVYAVHAKQLAEHGGRRGIRDNMLLQSALDAPKNDFLYRYTDIFKLAAIYGYLISHNQPFVDGNKRTAYVISRVFLILNGYDMDTSAVERVTMFLDISNNKKSEDDLGLWFKDRAVVVSS